MNETQPQQNRFSSAVWRFKFALLMGLFGCLCGIVLCGTIWLLSQHFDMMETEPSESEFNRWAMLQWFNSWVARIYEIPFRLPAGPFYHTLGTAGHFIAGAFWAVVGLPLDLGFWWSERKSGDSAAKRAICTMRLLSWSLAMLLLAYVTLFSLAYLFVL